MSKQIIRISSSKWSEPKYSKCYGSSKGEKVFPAGEKPGRPHKRGGI